MAFAAALEMAADPVAQSGVTNEFARDRIYHPAQRRDDIRGGEYPGARPRKQGTDMLTVLKVIRDMGACAAFKWAFSMDDVILGVGYEGPALLGTDCYDGMLHPDKHGFIHPVGKYLGGHGYLARGVHAEAGYFVIRMAWGRGWGAQGEAKLSFEDYDLLRRQQGEASFLVGRKLIDISALPPEQRVSWWARVFGR